MSSLVNCKVESKLTQTMYCVLSADGTDNANDKPDYIIFDIKGTKVYVPVVTLSLKEN